MSFTDIANKIVQDSIISSLYIDDKVVEPFEVIESENEKYFSVSKGLYSSFRSRNKSLDFYKFSPGRDWSKEVEYLFRNRDLLVLDWQLDDTRDNRQIDTLRILKQAVKTNNLHFVSIFTEIDEKRFDDIFYWIKSFFDISYSNDAVRKYKECLQLLDDEVVDYSFIRNVSGMFKELSLGASPEILTELKNVFIKNLGKQYRHFSDLLKSIDSDTKHSCEIIGFCANDALLDNEDPFEANLDFSFVNEKFVVINNTIVRLTNKKVNKPEDHFDFFTSALLKVCGNLLTLTSLEIRNLLRDSSAFIGKDADSIDEAALFHHQQSKENFFGFIIELWKSHSLSLVDYNADSLVTLNREFWDAYHSDKGTEANLDSLKREKEKFYGELGKLNTYYNSLNTLKRPNDKIRFGDIFTDKDGRYFLNITAHCDCEEPKENIKNNFYFVMGSRRPDLEKVLSSGDSDFFSYLNIGGRLVAIGWSNRPTVLNVQSRMESNKLVAKDGLGTDINLTYVKTLKESYAQRMANNSFAFAMRVGIDFVAP